MYATIGTSTAYRPFTGERPATSPYAIADGIASAATVMPASTSRRALGARYFGSSPVTGRIRVSSGSSFAGRKGSASP